MNDPLDAIEQLPVEAQIAVVVSVLRTTRNQLSRIEKKLDWVSRSIWALIATIVAGVAVYYLTVARMPRPAKASQTPALLSTPHSPLAQPLQAAILARKP